MERRFPRGIPEGGAFVSPPYALDSGDWSYLINAIIPRGRATPERDATCRQAYLSALNLAVHPRVGARSITIADVSEGYGLREYLIAFNALGE